MLHHLSAFMENPSPFFFFKFLLKEYVMTEACNSSHWFLIRTELSCRNSWLQKRNKAAWKQSWWEIETTQRRAEVFLVPGGFDYCSAVECPCTTVPARDSLFSLPLIWLTNQHYLNCFTAVCVYFTHTSTFLFLLLPTPTHTSKQRGLAVSLCIAHIHSYLANSSGLDPWPFDWGLILILLHLTI